MEKQCSNVSQEIIVIPTNRLLTFCTILMMCVMVVGCDTYSRAVRLTKQGDLAGAEAILREAEDCPSRAHLGELLTDKGDLVGAEAELRKAIKLCSEAGNEGYKYFWWWPHSSLARIFKEKGDLAGAEAELHKTLKLCSEYAMITSGPPCLDSKISEIRQRLDVVRKEQLQKTKIKVQEELKEQLNKCDQEKRTVQTFNEQLAEAGSHKGVYSEWATCHATVYSEHFKSVQFPDMDLVSLYNKRLLALAKKLDRKTIEPEDFEVELAEAWSTFKTEALARNTQRQMVVQQKELAKGQSALFQLQKQIREEERQAAYDEKQAEMWGSIIDSMVGLPPSGTPPSYWCTSLLSTTTCTPF